MLIRELEVKLGNSNDAKAWIEKVYAKYPQTWQNNHVMPLGDEQFAMFELVPSFSKRGAVEVKWFQAYPLRQGVGSRAMKELQTLAREDGIGLTLFPWDKGQVSQAKLTKFYKGQGFKPTVKGGKSLAWETVDEARSNPDQSTRSVQESLENWMEMYSTPQDIQTILSSSESAPFKKPPNIQWLYRAIVPKDRDINSIKSTGQVVAFATDMQGAINFIRTLEIQDDWVIIRKPFNPSDFLLDFTGMYEAVAQGAHSDRYVKEHEVWMKPTLKYTSAKKNEIVYSSKEYYNENQVYPSEVDVPQRESVTEGSGNDIETIIQSFVASPVGQKYKQHDCKTVTRAFVQWAEQNKIPTQVVSLAPPSADFIAKNPRYKGKSGQGDGHIMPIVNGNAIDFTVRQFGVSRPFENPLITPVGSLPAVYGKFGYFTDKPEWFLGGKSHWIGALNSIPSEIFNQNFGDELLEQKRNRLNKISGS